MFVMKLAGKILSRGAFVVFCVILALIGLAIFLFARGNPAMLYALINPPLFPQVIYESIGFVSLLLFVGMILDSKGR